MAALAALNAITTLLRANWAHSTIRAYDASLQSLVPTDASAYAELTFPFSQEEQISIGDPGNNIFRETGGFLFAVMVPISESLPTWLGYIDTLRDALRNQRLLSGHLRIYEVASPVIDESFDIQAYRDLTLAVPYEYDIFR